MFYPRNSVEMNAVLQFFESSEKGKEKTFPPDTTIRVGYKVQRPVQYKNATFVSVDKKLNISFAQNPDLFIRYGDPGMKQIYDAEKGPVLCITQSTYLTYLAGCLPRLLQNYTVCFLDFNWKNS